MFQRLQSIITWFHHSMPELMVNMMVSPCIMVDHMMAPIVAAQMWMTEKQGHKDSNIPCDAIISAVSYSFQLSSPVPQFPPSSNSTPAGKQHTNLGDIWGSITMLEMSIFFHFKWIFYSLPLTSCSFGSMYLFFNLKFLACMYKW